MNRRLPRWSWLAWLALCALLFVALRGAEDPSRPKGRILSIDAGQRALAWLRASDPKYEGYAIVHVAFARSGEGGPGDRWVVLLDRVPHTQLREAVVVELSAGDGRVLRSRAPAER